MFLLLFDKRLNYIIKYQILEEQKAFFPKSKINFCITLIYLLEKKYVILYNSKKYYLIY